MNTTDMYVFYPIITRYLFGQSNIRTPEHSHSAQEFPKHLTQPKRQTPLRVERPSAC